MKVFISIGCLMVFSAVSHAGEKDVWYDATGKIVKVTPAEIEKERWVPLWQRREAAREARRGRGRVQRTRSSYWHPYGGYGGYGHGYSHGWSFRPAHHGHHYHHYSHGGGHSPFRFRGAYHGSGWSVRVGF